MQHVIPPALAKRSEESRVYLKRRASFVLVDWIPLVTNSSVRKPGLGVTNAVCHPEPRITG